MSWAKRQLVGCLAKLHNHVHCKLGLTLRSVCLASIPNICCPFGVLEARKGAEGAFVVGLGLFCCFF